MNVYNIIGILMLVLIYLMAAVVLPIIMYGISTTVFANGFILFVAAWTGIAVHLIGRNKK